MQKFCGAKKIGTDVFGRFQALFGNYAAGSGLLYAYMPDMNDCGSSGGVPKKSVLSYARGNELKYNKMY